MNRKALITLILGTALAVAPAAHAMQLSDGTNGTRSAPSIRTADAKLTPAEYYQLTLRGEPLNQPYGSSVTIRPDILGGDGGESTSPISTSTGPSVPWNAAIAGAALVGAMLLALGFAVTNRRRHQLSF
jgi:hypothetical protein